MKTKSEVLEMIQSFSSLRRGWDFYHAEPIPVEVCGRAYLLTGALQEVPEVFPTGRKSIQLEFTNGSRELEVEVFVDRYEYIVFDNVLAWLPHEETDAMEVIDFIERFMEA